MSDNRVDQERRSWDEAENASSELPSQLRVLHRLVAAARAQLEELSAGSTPQAEDKASDRDADIAENDAPQDTPKTP